MQEPPFSHSSDRWIHSVSTSEEELAVSVLKKFCLYSAEIRLMKIHPPSSEEQELTAFFFFTVKIFLLNR